MLHHLAPSCKVVFSPIWLFDDVCFICLRWSCLLWSLHVFVNVSLITPFFMSLTALCICFCVFWPFLVSLCLLTTPCIWLRKCCRIDCWCEPAQPTLTLPHSSQIVALPPSPLPSVVKSTNTKTKTHECEIQFDTYALSTMSLNWPMGDGYWLCLWNKTLQKTEVFLEFWSDLSPIIVATYWLIITVTLVVDTWITWICLIKIPTQFLMLMLDLMLMLMMTCAIVIW